MNRSDAEQFMAEGRELTAAFDQSVRKWRDVYGPEGDWLQYRRLAGRVMGWLLLEMKRPISSSYPHLDPIGGDAKCKLMEDLKDGDLKERIHHLTTVVEHLSSRFGYAVQGNSNPHFADAFNEAQADLSSALQEIRELLTKS